MSLFCGWRRCWHLMSWAGNTCLSIQSRTGYWRSHLDVTFLFPTPPMPASPQWLSHSPFTTTPSQTFVTSCSRKRLRVHLRGWGGSKPAAISRSQNLKKGVFSEKPSCYKALKFLAPMSNTVAKQLPVPHCGRLHKPLSRKQVSHPYCFHKSNWKPLVASTLYVDHKALRPVKNAQYCLSSQGFQGPQSLQYSQSSEWDLVKHTNIKQQEIGTGELHRNLG
jgi:hypothetical protein